jgi:hypothetical protein
VHVTASCPEPDEYSSHCLILFKIDIILPSMPGSLLFWYCNPNFAHISHPCNMSCHYAPASSDQPNDVLCCAQNIKLFTLQFSSPPCLLGTNIPTGVLFWDIPLCVLSLSITKQVTPIQNYGFHTLIHMNVKRPDWTLCVITYCHMPHEVKVFFMVEICVYFIFIKWHIM